MRIGFENRLSFGRQLSAEEKADFSAVLKRSKKKLGNTGHSMLIVPSISLPQANNTGVGNLLDEEGKGFLNFAKELNVSFSIICFVYKRKNNFRF